jgi:hypothetical protein
MLVLYCQQKRLGKDLGYLARLGASKQVDILFIYELPGDLAHGCRDSNPDSLKHLAAGPLALGKDGKPLAFFLEVEKGGFKEDQIQTLEEMPLTVEELFFNDVFGEAR